MILVTGAAGFIGFHTVRRLLREGFDVLGVDNLNNYYDVRLKEARLSRLGVSIPTGGFPGGVQCLALPIRDANGQMFPGRLRFIRLDLVDTNSVLALFDEHQFSRVVHLAAQAGVRYSLTHPLEYIDTNVRATANILEGCRAVQCEHLVFASSSSVYGANTQVPYSVHDGVDHPISLYAATKRAGELLVHSYSHLYKLPATGLRFFTVYGPWGRPDMALFKFVDAIVHDRPVDIFNNGRMRRDFTYIDDIAEGVVRILERPPRANPFFDWTNPDPAGSDAPWRLFNFGNASPVELLRLVEIIEETLGKKALKRFKTLQPGDMLETNSSPDELPELIGTLARTTVEEGVARFVRWYRDEYIQLVSER